MLASIAAVALAATINPSSVDAAKPTHSQAHGHGKHVRSSDEPRTIVTTDGEVDDQDSFLRFLLYANEMDVEGLVYSSSQWHYKGDGKGTLFISEMENTARRYGYRTDLRWPGETWMQEFIGKYAQVYDTLRLHDRSYPTPKRLLDLVEVGNIEFEGEMAKDTEGSDHIKEVLLDDKPGPVYLQVWGGTNTIARALKSIEDQYKGTRKWARIYRKVSEKAVIYTVLYQDATYTKYVAPNWPEIKVIYNSDQFWNFAYRWRNVVPAELQSYLKGEWMAENIVFNHGPLLSEYYVWGDGRQIDNDPEHTHGDVEQAMERDRMHDFISEGDSPAFLHLFDVGLRNIEDPSYGGWGGRFVQSLTNPFRWEDGPRATDYNPFTGEQSTSYPQTRWIDVIQNDFAARADWTVKGYRDANHAPEVRMPDGRRDIRVRPGQTVRLVGWARDPDRDAVTPSWWQYGESDTYPGTVDISGAETWTPRFTVPADAHAGDTIHIVLEVSDGGSPQLTRYDRVIATVK